MKQTRSSRPRWNWPPGIRSCIPGSKNTVLCKRVFWKGFSDIEVPGRVEGANHFGASIISEPTFTEASAAGRGSGSYHAWIVALVRFLPDLKVQ